MTDTTDDGLRIIFAGTPDFAAHHLAELIDSKHRIIGVYTQPDRPAGRGKKLTSSPVKQLAEAHDLPVFQPQSLKDEKQQQQLALLNADVMVVVAYGLLLPQVVLDTPRYGCLNVHASLLPRWRGAAPIQRAIGAGDTHSGVTIMQMDQGLDTGDMLAKVDCKIEDSDTSVELHDKLMAMGAPALLQTLSQLANNTLKPVPQDDNLACYAAKITKEEALIDWQRPAREVILSVRAFNPFPIAYTLDGGERIKIHRAQLADIAETVAPGEIQQVSDNGLVVSCGQGAIVVTTLQLPGKKAMTMGQLFNGHPNRFVVGQILGGNV